MHAIVIGHRGASGYRPEHTRSAYDLAFALGADAVEPDLVATRDGVLVVRHENEISSTTDVAARPEFADRRTTKRVDGAEQTGWFTEDFTWEQLSTLRARERLPALRQHSTSFNDRFPLLRLSDLFELVDQASERIRRPLGLVAEIKHASYFDSIGLNLVDLFAAAVNEAGWNTGDGRLTVESFEPSVLDRVAHHGLFAKRIFLLEETGAPFDEVLRLGAEAPDYASWLTEQGLYGLGRRVDGISVPKSLILRPDAAGGGSELVDDAHAAGLEVYTWTLRPENRFLATPFQAGTRKADFGNWPGEFDAILAAGVDGVFADHPDLAVIARDDRAEQARARTGAAPHRTVSSGPHTA